MSFIGYDRRVIYDPAETLTLEQRAHQMWAIHPRDLNQLGFVKREDFYLAHLKAAVGQATEAATEEAGS